MVVYGSTGGAEDEEVNEEGTSPDASVSPF